ncbi:MAG: glucosidase [Rhodospirillales bacterium]|nr:glucosidase [Rhodospirillales bacterium]
MNTPEHRRLDDAANGQAAWRKWGPYLSERQWGTVREDYSADGDPWRYFTHDQSRSRSYRWGEDGLAGFSDDQQFLCFAVALWNGQDPILKERLFGLANNEGNHGEDVKEVYYYLDATPTYSYARYLYKYPHAAFPYLDLVKTNAGRGRNEPEHELIDTGAFAAGRYFDVDIEYAKDSPEDILIAIRVTNRGPEPATLYVLPTLWFRNTWSWDSDTPKPNLKQVEKKSPTSIVAAVHPELGVRYLYCEGAPVVHFTENETNNRRLFGGHNAAPFVKDGINDHVISGVKAAVNPKRTGTKAAARYGLSLAAGESGVLRLRLADGTPSSSDRAGGPFAGFDAALAARRAEADAFYAAILPTVANGAEPDLASGANGVGGGDFTAEDAKIARQALAGMLWNKQYYNLDAARWLAEHGASGLPAQPGPRRPARNRAWTHLAGADVIATPDTWEYPWYAGWDLALQSLPLALVDCAFAKQQLLLLLEERYLHPNGQLPSSEWDFAAVDPPLHAWAVWSVYSLDKARRGGAGDRSFLRDAFSRLLMNFTWWANRRDTSGRDLLSGGLVGIDAVDIFDRSVFGETGAGHLETSAGCAWMAFNCAHMLQSAVELAVDDPASESLAIKFYNHLLSLAVASEDLAGAGLSLWNEADGFFYDVVRAPGGVAAQFAVRAFAGLLPLCASAIIPRDALDRLPRLEARLRRGLQGPGLADPSRPGQRDRRLVALVDEGRLRRLLARMLDENEFLSPFGIRSLSAAHRDTPAALMVTGANANAPVAVGYEPGEAGDGLGGGNVNWRGPIWLSLNTLLVQALLQHYLYYGNRLRIECPTGSGQRLTLYEIAEALTHRLAAIFRLDATGRRPFLGPREPMQTDPHWRDGLLFFEYFHGDDARGLGASHQTGGTGLIAPLLRFFSTMTADEFLQGGDRGSLLSYGRREAWPATARV